MGWAKTGGSYGSGPNQAANLPTTTVYEGPPFHGPQDVTGAPYGQEPYVRAQLPDRGTVDAVARRWSRTHVLIHWEADSKAFSAWVPAKWVQRITEEESRYRPVDRIRPRNR